MEAVRTKLIWIYILNVTDMLFTWFLLRTGCFVEANFLMKDIISSGFFSVVFKVVLPFLLLSLLSFRMRKASAKQLEKANLLINLCMIGYFAINVSHIFWTGMYFFT